MSSANQSGPGSVGLQPGTKIGKYVVRQRTAIGGQAILYICHDPMLDRLVAIKQISSHLAEDPKFLDRFRKEAQILARLCQQQPAVVTIHELLEDERGLFIVMEYVEGKTLETVLQENPQPVEPKAVLAILWRLASAMHDVHSAGIIHRDIKPGNIIIQEGLRPKITDFGVAASVSGQTSMVLGTTKYMAPELLSGEPFDARSDVYSLGFVAYEMLIGREKFNEVFADVVRDKHSESLRWMKWHSNAAVTAPPAHEVNPAVPAALSRIVSKMLAKAPADRFDSMESLGRAIREEFSPKAKSAGHAHHRAQAAPSAKGKTGPLVAEGEPITEPGDELEISAAGPATAPLPRKRFTRRTKFFLGAGAGLLVLLTVLGAVVYDSMRNRQIDDQARVLYDEAKAAFTNDAFSDARAKYASLIKLYPQTKYTGVSSVMVPLCEGYVAVDEGDWTAAANKQAAAKDANEHLQRTGSTQQVEWTRKEGEDLRKRFETYRLGMKVFRDAMDRAQNALTEKRFDDARSAIATVTGPTEQTRAMLAAFKTRIDAEDTLATVESHFTRGKELADKANFDDAEREYLAVGDVLKRPQADSLEKSQKQEIETRADAQLKALGGMRSLAAILAEKAKALAEGDKRRELAAVQEAMKIREDAALKKRQQELRAAILTDEAAQLEKAGQYSEARKKMEEAVQIDPSADAQKNLERVRQIEQSQALVAEGDTAFAAGKFQEALAKYEEAQRKGQVASPVLDKIRDCHYRIGLAEAEKLWIAGKFEEAMAKYDSLREIKPDAATEIDVRQSAVRLDWNYSKQMTAGEEALAKNRWAAAMEAFSKAKELKNTPEVQARMDFTKFSEYLARGKAAMDSSQWTSAMGYLKIAKGSARKKAEIDEVDSLLQKVEQQLSPGGGG